MNPLSRRVVVGCVIRCQLTDGLLSPDQSDWGQLSQLEPGFRLSHHRIAAAEK